MIQITRRPLVLVSGCSYRKGATSCHTREIWNVCYAHMVGTSSLCVFWTERDFELEPSSSLTSTPVRSQAIHTASAVLVPLLPDCRLILIYIYGQILKPVGTNTCWTCVLLSGTILLVLVLENGDLRYVKLVILPFHSLVTSCKEHVITLNHFNAGR